MGQKVNPHGLRVGVIKDWDSRWFASNEKVGDLLVEDYKIREYLKNTLYNAGIPKIEIERDSTKVKVFLHCARPGMVIGRGGTEIEALRLKLERMIGKPVALNIIEIRSPDLNAQLVAENIASQLEKRIGFRRAMKQSMGRAMRLGARGIKTSVSGRLGGAEIARTEHYHEGTIPLQTLRADIDYGFAEAKTTYGRIGVKVWIYKGEVLQSSGRKLSRSIEPPRPRTDRRDNRRNDNRRNNNFNRNDNRSGGNRNFNNNNQGNRPYNNQGGNRPFNNNAGGQNRSFNNNNNTGNRTFNNNPGPNRTEGGNR